MKTTSTISLCLRVVNIPFLATCGLTSVRNSYMPAEKLSFAHFFCTYVALLETACYQFGFNAASGFILLQFFLEQI